MGALVRTNAAISASFKTIGLSRFRVLPVGRILAREPRAFPEARTRRTLPTAIRDEMLELYVFIFCRGGFRQLGMTFERFLLVPGARCGPGSPLAPSIGHVGVWAAAICARVHARW